MKLWLINDSAKMRTSRITITFIIILLLESLMFFQSCTEHDEDRVVSEEAILFWGGDYAVDGVASLLKLTVMYSNPKMRILFRMSIKSTNQQLS